MVEGFRTGNYEWNYTASRVVGSERDMYPSSLRSFDAECLACGARWNARSASDTEPGHFFPALGHFILTCPHCQQQATIQNPPSPS
jgi:hypothetical protein